MSYDRRTRDRFRVVVAGVTGGVGVAAFTATGLLMGLASRDLAEQQAEQPANQQAQQQAQQQARQQARQQAQPGKAAQARKQKVAERRAARHPLLRQRPQVTRVTVRYVTVTGDSNQVGSGGAVTTSPAAPVAQPAAQPAPAPAPAPNPPPAPSSGS